MSIIQQIQEKYAKLMAIIIALALIIFVVMLAFENGGSLFRSNNSQVVGKVNGKEILYTPLSKQIDDQEDRMKQQGYPMQGSSSRYMALDNVWAQELQRLLVMSEVEKLGMEVTKREIGDMLYGSNPPPDLRQGFTDSATGEYDAARAKEFIDQQLRSGTSQDKERFNAYFTQLEYSRLNEKYVSLLSNSINFPKWVIEKQNEEANQMAKISFVREVYASIPDSAVAVSDKEIQDYINAHKDEFEQKEESRSIAYVTFSALPSSADSATAKNNLLALKPGFDTTADPKGYVLEQGQRFYDSYINGGTINVAGKDSFLRQPVGVVSGPFLNENSPYPNENGWVLAKVLGVRSQPDTVSVRHILVGLVGRDPMTGQEMPLRDSATAHKLADSIKTAIANGANFDTLLYKFSTDYNSIPKGGKYENTPAGDMVESFNDFMFTNPTGAKGVVPTRFGSHYMEILSQKGRSPAYKVAYLFQPIEVSNETDADASIAANTFASESTDIKSFDANVEKLKSKGIIKMVQSNISPNSYQLNIGPARGLIKKIFDAEVGEVVQPEKVGTNYVVAIVTGIDKKGTQSVATARLMIEPVLRNRKKAELIAKKLNGATTLEAAASAWGGKQIEVADSLRFDGGGNTTSAIIYEPKVMGAAFNPANKGKVTSPIYGQSGVIVVRVDNTWTTPAVNPVSIDEQRRQRYEQAKGAVNPYGALMEAATIKDNRIKFF